MARDPHRIAFFMPPRQFLEILSRVVVGTEVAVVFQRFKSDEFGPGVHVIPRGADLEAMYREGRYGPIYLSVGGLPEHETDWGFIERFTGDLVRVELGATAPGQIALSEIYGPMKSVRVRPLFEALEREIAGVSHQGVHGSRHAYPEIYWSEEVRPLALYRALGKEASRFEIDG